MGYELKLANSERDVAQSELSKITSLVEKKASSQAVIEGLKSKVKEMEEEKGGWEVERARLMSIGEAHRTQKEECLRMLRERSKGRVTELALEASTAQGGSMQMIEERRRNEIRGYTATGGMGREGASAAITDLEVRIGVK
jgi:hypothetical protein